MTGPWVARLDAGTTPRQLGSLRLFPEIETARQPSDRWLRGPSIDDALRDHLHRLPLRQLYALKEPDYLVPEGDQLPTRQLANLDWQTLKSFLPLQRPAIGLPAAPTSPTRLTLKSVPGPATEANALLTDFPTWASWVETAPAVRITSLHFALSESGETFVHGTPLPPIPGRFFRFEENIAVPLATQLHPPFQSETLHRILGLSSGEIALIDEQGLRRLSRESLIPASLSAVRLSQTGVDLDPEPTPSP
ncbi:MAG: hypothetical protein AAF514_00235 [Verrucomicrobiota bacterium]